MKTAQITIKFRENGLTFFYSKAFQNAVIIGMKFLKSGEWIYPIYRTDNNEKLSGYIYEGDVLTFSQIAEILQKFTPPFLKDFTDFQKRFTGRIEYLKQKPDAHQIVGEYSEREIVVRK